MTNILISIKPKYVEKIISKEKKYEFRKTCPVKKIDNLIIYSTAPVKKVIGKVEVLDVIKDNKDSLWQKVKEDSGISKKEYDEYFKNTNYAVVIKLGKILLFNKEKELKDYGVLYAPQSFIYLNE